MLDFTSSRVPIAIRYYILSALTFLHTKPVFLFQDLDRVPGVLYSRLWLEAETGMCAAPQPLCRLLAAENTPETAVYACNTLRWVDERPRVLSTRCIDNLALARSLPYWGLSLQDISTVNKFEKACRLRYLTEFCVRWYGMVKLVCDLISWIYQPEPPKRRKQATVSWFVGLPI